MSDHSIEYLVIDKDTQYPEAICKTFEEAMVVAKWNNKEQRQRYKIKGVKVYHNPFRVEEIK